MDIEEARDEIDQANKDIVSHVRDRMDAVLKIADMKGRTDSDIRDRQREQEVKDQFEDLFESKKLPPERGREMAELLIETAVDVQEEVLDR
jgi:Chorismate mutase type II.